AGPARQDTAGEPSSRTPQHITTLPPGIPPTGYRVNKLPLIHGAWQGPWVWDEVRRYLDFARIASATVALPSVGEDTGKLGGLADDVAAVSAVLDELSGPFVLVGHSYSGVPGTEVAAAR